MVRPPPRQQRKMVKANRKTAAAQGIVAQVRVFGGSLGIAASSAILGLSLQARVGGSVTPQQIASVEAGGADLAQSDLAAIRRAYSDAFREDMRVCTIIAGIALLWRSEHTAASESAAPNGARRRPEKRLSGE